MSQSTNMEEMQETFTQRFISMDEEQTHTLTKRPKIQHESAQFTVQKTGEISLTPSEYEMTSSMQETTTKKKIDDH
ncbi:hypothetical protein F8M41_007193 [Gigaspora margarita]|uniref:Uncharacterized protein n=1 Tax=Gigaspora margarita TaxID=4874 RepID=A0A8H4A3J2_GIGMA|nr:hypothetical protein F8M41_007193 [Gigaspora margarita]